MKYALILGMAASGLALTAGAQPAPEAPPPPHAMMMMMHGPGPDLNVDANHDGWISRAEAGSAADRMFDHMDANHDGRLTPDDHHALHTSGDHVIALPEDGNCQTSTEDQGSGDHRVTVICHGAPGQHAGMPPLPDDPNCHTTTEDQGHGQRRVTVICDNDEEHANNGDGAHHVERRVVITRNGDAPQAEHGEQHSESQVIIRRVEDGAETPEAPGTPAAPRPPHPPHPPMMMMLFANSEEADTNHDGALSRDEFRTQQLRFFDASDANHDGKIRFEPPPMPPMPPMPPTPPPPGAPPEAPTPPAPPHH